VPPILHLSIPVRDLGEAREFYERALGCEVARRRDGFCDVWFYGMQITLQDRAEEVRDTEAGSRHFGVTLGSEEFETVMTRLHAAGVHWVTPMKTDHEGSALEQTKAKLSDPSGNVIELKTYRDVEAALEISRPEDLGAPRSRG
jgi:extradiol dioxygenase family protein